MHVIDTQDGSKTLFSDRYGEPFASHKGALTESRYVFLEGSGVTRQLEAGETVRVLEVGFGTGLNFFLTAQACLAHPEARLEYTALERDLLPADALNALGYEGLLTRPEILTAYTSWRDALLPSPAPGPATFTFGPVRLTLLLGEATAQALPEGAFHAVYQDAFSPAANPELWTEAFLGRLHGALQEGGTLSSYCVKGSVRRLLSGLGFDVLRRPGPPGGKREVLFARKPRKG